MDTKTTLFALFAVVVIGIRNLIIAVMEEKATGKPGSSLAAQVYEYILVLKKRFSKSK